MASSPQKFTNKETSVIDTTQGNQFVEDVWMLQEEIEGHGRQLHRATSCHHRVKPACFVFDKGIASSIT